MNKPPEYTIKLTWPNNHVDWTTPAAMARSNLLETDLVIWCPRNRNILRLSRSDIASLACNNAPLEPTTPDGAPGDPAAARPGSATE
jgi:hypothetical protein